MIPVILIAVFLILIVLGVPISFVIGMVSLLGIFFIPDISGIVVFMKMFTGLNSFVLVAIPLFILAGNLMNYSSISDKLINFSIGIVGHIRGGLAHSNILVSMIFAGVSGSSQADTAGVGKVLIPKMEENGYEKEVSVGTTAASSTLGSIIPPSIIMVIYAGIANVSTGGLFLAGIIPGLLLGGAMMCYIYVSGIKKNYPKYSNVSLKERFALFIDAFPALLTPVIIIVGIVSGLYTPTEAAAFACLYSLFLGFFYYKTINLQKLKHVIVDTLKLSSLSLFALSTASALGELLGYYNVSAIAAQFFLSLPGGIIFFMLIVILFFLFLGTFMDAVPAMILFVPVILPSAKLLGIDPIHLGVVIVITLSLGLITPPYGLCLLIASNISNISIERAFKGVIPFLLVALAILLFVAFMPSVIVGIPKFIAPGVFG